MRSQAPAAAAPASTRSARPAAARSGAELTPESSRHEGFCPCAGTGGTADAAGPGERRPPLPPAWAAALGGCAGEAPSCPLRRAGLRPRLAGRVAGCPQARPARPEGSVPWPPRPGAADRPPAAAPRRVPASSAAGHRAAAPRSARPARRRGGKLSGCIVVPALGHLGGGRGPRRRDPSLPGRAGSGDAAGGAVAVRQEPSRRSPEPRRAAPRQRRRGAAGGRSRCGAGRPRRPRGAAAGACGGAGGAALPRGAVGVKAAGGRAEGACPGGGPAIAVAKGDWSVGTGKPSRQRCRVHC